MSQIVKTTNKNILITYTLFDPVFGVYKAKKGGLDNWTKTGSTWNNRTSFINAIKVNNVYKKYNTDYLVVIKTVHILQRVGNEHSSKTYYYRLSEFLNNKNL